MADSNPRIVLTAEDKTAAAFASLRAGLSGVSNQATSLRGVFATLLPSVTFAGAAAYFKSINDGVDALNDLKDATGASIENISALEDVAARTGTSFETVGTSLIKLNLALNQANPDSDAAKALQAIGLNAAELKKIDPAEALRRTAVALSGFADDGNKARLVQELFGKSLREVAPLLNDLATQTELVAKVTTEQAEEAEKFNHQLFNMQKNSKDAARALTADLVTGLNAASKAFKESGLLEGLKTLIGGTDEFMASKTLVQDTDKLLNLENAIAQAKAAGAKEDGRLLSNLLEQKRQTEENIKLTQNYLKVLRGDTSLTGEKPKGKVDATAVDFDPDRDKRILEQNKKARDLDLAGWVKYAQDRVDADFEATKQIADNQIKTNDELLAAREKMMQQWFDSIDQEQEDAINEGAEVLRRTEEEAKRVRDVARELGLTFSSAFEDAVVGGKQFSEVLQGIAQDIARIILRKTVTEPLAAKVSGIDFGGLLGGWFGGGSGTDVGVNGTTDLSYANFAEGGIMTADGPLPLRKYANGGIANSPQAAIFGEGSMNEAFIPLPDGRRVPVNLQGSAGGSGQIVYSPVIQIDSRTDRREVYELVDRAVRSGNAQLVDELTRKGKI